MKISFINKITFLLFLLLLVSSCTEQYVLKTNSFENAIVVEATITNEFKKQEIKISRTYKLEENGPTFESGAEVYITDNDGDKYQFEEASGVYISTSEFQAVPGKTYRLNIITNEGKSYTSTTETLTAATEIQSIVPSVGTKDGVKGVELYVNSFDPNGASKYYRYKFEETYKIIAPKWNPFEAIVIPKTPDQEYDDVKAIYVGNFDRKICYSTDYSKDIILTTTSELSEDRVHFPVRFININNPIIAHRYSILVLQYVQNLASYTFYKTLKELSGSESILSQNQPGFFYGNMKSVDAPNEKVIGFFEVSSVSSKRIFFNYVDLFPNEKEPPYFVNCLEQKFKFCFSDFDHECRGRELITIINSSSLLYVAYSGGFYNMTLPVCVDCTSFSSNVIPPFWID